MGKPMIVGAVELAHNTLAWIHRIFSNVKAWGIGACHGPGAKYVQSCLNGFVFRFNLGLHRHAGLKSLPQSGYEEQTRDLQNIDGV